MARREPLHRLIDELLDEDLPAVTRVLQALRATADPAMTALEAAPPDDEPDHDDFDGGLTEAREDVEAGRGITTKELRQVEPLPFRIRAFVDGLQPGIDPDKMNQLLDELQAEEFARKYRG